jgi:hypothetical protein
VEVMIEMNLCVKWRAQCALGWFCYLIIMKLPSWHITAIFPRLRAWMLSWAEFYWIEGGK